MYLWSEIIAELTVDLFQTDGENQQENLPLDFKRKLEEWEKMKGGTGTRQCEELAAEAPVETCRRDNSTEKKVHYCDLDFFSKTIAS